jgi:hypothetical protein
VQVPVAELAQLDVYLVFPMLLKRGDALVGVLHCIGFGHVLSFCAPFLEGCR